MSRLQGDVLIDGHVRIASLWMTNEDAVQLINDAWLYGVQYVIINAETGVAKRLHPPDVTVATDEPVPPAA